MTVYLAKAFVKFTVYRKDVMILLDFAQVKTMIEKGK